MVNYSLGDYVEILAITPFDPLEMHKTIGTVGELVAISAFDKSIQVRFQNGKRWWYHFSNVRLAERPPIKFNNTLIINEVQNS